MTCTLPTPYILGGDSKIIFNEEVYDLGITEVLRQNGQVYDEYVLEDGQAKIIRRINSDGTIKTAEEIEDLGEFNLNLQDGLNSISIMNYNAEITAKYVIQSDYTDVFATKVEMNSSITQTAEEINLEVSKKVGEDEVCSVISQSAEEILLKGNRVLIESDYFNLAKNGKVEVIDAPAESSTTEVDANFIVRNVENNRKVQITPNRILLSGGTAKSYMWNTTGWAYIGVSSDNTLGRCRMISAGADLTFIDCSDGNDTTTIRPTGIETPNVTQTSLEEVKKNISKVEENALDIVKNAEIYNYNLKSEKDTDKKHYGFVIGEKYRTPDEVIANSGEGIDIYSMCSILWKAVQEQQKQIEELKEGK